jgi:hypothetical protein
MTTSEPRFGRDDAIRIACLAWIVLCGFGYAAALALDWDDETRLSARDFWCFFRAGELLLAGQSAYAQVDRAFANPPFTLPLVAVLPSLGVRGAYVVIAVVGSIAMVLGAAATVSLGEGSARERGTVALAIATSPSFFLALHLGQLSGVYFALLSGALALLVSGRHGAAGAMAALLLAKPNLAVALIGAALVVRAWRFLAALSVVALALLVVSLPFGLAAWSEWLGAVAYLAQRHDAAASDLWKQHTLYALVRSTLTAATARIAWAAVAVAIGAAIVATLVALRSRLEEREIGARVASLIVLATCALNTYLFYYDTLLLALPAAMLFLARASWTRRGLHRAAIACAVAAWILQAEVTLVHDHRPVLGAVTTAWLLIELLDLRAADLRATDLRTTVALTRTQRSR